MALLLDRILRGEWEANRRLPSEEQLETQYSVSKATVRQALHLLVSGGYVRREQGRGTFVARRQVELGPLSLTSFGEEMRAYGMQPESRVLSKSIVRATPEIAGKLSLGEGEAVFCLRRLRLADGQPMGIQTAYIPAVLAAPLLSRDFESDSLYELLESVCGLSLRSMPARRTMR